MTLTEKALRLAMSAHEGQVRKSDGSPYIVHPIMVGIILTEYGFVEEVVAAGLCHDVFEDTAVSRNELVAVLGEVVAEIVDGVSEDKSLNWEERKQQYVQAVVGANEFTKAVSIADKIHNAESIISDYESKGSAVWEPFNRGKEKKLWFEELTYSEVNKVWQHPLLERYKQAIDTLRTLD